MSDKTKAKAKTKNKATRLPEGWQLTVSGAPVHHLRVVDADGVEVIDARSGALAKILLLQQALLDAISPIG
ncbi:MAG: hypothetical protein GY772_27150 [bacterium]|nr:hypothetical protein [bacterium]